MTKLRLIFTKHGPAVYISHLDLLRTLQRALHRAQVDLAYSEGFNPHPLLTFAMPLSLGFSSDCEILDIKINASYDLDDLKTAINATLPNGLHITSLYEGGAKLKEIGFAGYDMTLTFPTVGADAPVRPPSIDLIQAFFARPALLTEKKTKKGITTIDLAPHVHHLSITADNNGLVTVSLTLPCSETLSLNPTLFINLMKAENLIADAAVCRTQFYTKDFTAFH